MLKSISRRRVSCFTSAIRHIFLDSPIASRSQTSQAAPVTSTSQATPVTSSSKQQVLAALRTKLDEGEDVDEEFNDT